MREAAADATVKPRLPPRRRHGPCGRRPETAQYFPIVIMRHADGNVVSLMECPHCEIHEAHGLARPDDEKTFQCRWCSLGSTTPTRAKLPGGR